MLFSLQMCRRQHNATTVEFNYGARLLGKLNFTFMFKQRTLKIKSSNVKDWIWNTLKKRIIEEGTLASHLQSPVPHRRSVRVASNYTVDIMRDRCTLDLSVS
jgi:hypothetical protein